MDVFRSVGGKVVVDNKVHLLNIDASAQQISRNEDTRRARTELLHHIHTLRHLHISTDARNNELMLGQLVSKLLDPLLPVGEDHALGNDHVLVELDQGSEFLAVFLEGDVELLDTVEGKLLVLDEDLDWILHELVGHFHDLRRHGGREQANLNIMGEVFEDLSDLVHETSAQHLVSLIENNHLKVISLEGFSVDEIFDPTRCSDHNLNASIFQCIPILLGIRASDAATCGNVDELAEAEDDLVDLLGELSGGGEDDGLALW